jgi:Spy/CpxP family protein refolding chaperone
MKGGERMKRAIVLTGFLVVLLVAVLAYAQGPGMMGSGQGWNYCPYCGQNLGQGGGYGMGRGMMGGGYGMGPGMMGGGYGMGPGMMGPGYSQQNEACQKFFDDTAAMRKDLHTKRYEYFETIRNPKTTPETVAKLEKDLRELQAKIYEKAPQGCW